MNIKAAFLFFSLILFLQSCNSIEPPPDNTVITLSLEDAASIEAWLKLTTNNIRLPATVMLNQSTTGGDQTSETINLISTDTLIYIDSLLPNTTYSFHAAIQPSNQAEVKSNVLSVTTLDTTSHDFTFETFTFGEHSSSVLRDVAIINENNIWAVGEIYLNDSLGQPDPHAYNAVHWDGIEWKPLRIKFYTICGQQSRTPYPTSAIFAINENEIWVGMDGRQIAKISEITQVETICPPFSMIINKIWGASSNDLYLVGNSGNIAYYNGISWQKIESGTNLNVGDIWGVPDGGGDYRKYLAAVDAMLVINTGNNLTRINVEPGHSISSIWGMTDRLIYTAGGSGLSLYKNRKWEKINRPDLKTIYNIRGQGYNDIFGISSTRTILHFNGYSWKSYSEMPGGSLLISIKMRDHLVVTVGINNPKAFIAVGRRT